MGFRLPLFRYLVLGFLILSLTCNNNHLQVAAESTKKTQAGSPAVEEAKPTDKEGSGSESQDDVASTKTKKTKVKTKVQAGDDRMEPDEIKDLFDRFDEDSNGYLNRKELFHYFVVTTPPDSAMGKKYKQKDYFNLVRYREFCKSVDADPLVGLTLENIKNAYEKHYGYAHKDWVVTAGMRSLKIPRREKAHVKDAFTEFDRDSNGFLNWPEFKQMVPSYAPENYEKLADALDADPSEGIDLHGVLKAYTRKSGAVRKYIKAWEKPRDEIIIVEKGNQMAAWILVVFFLVCLVAPILAWFCGVHKTVQGRRVVKRAAQQMQEIAKAT